MLEFSHILSFVGRIQLPAAIEGNFEKLSVPDSKRNLIQHGSNVSIDSLFIALKPLTSNYFPTPSFLVVAITRRKSANKVYFL